MDDPASCLKAFRQNRDAGAILFFSLLAGVALDRSVMDQFTF